jgi:cytochrome c-type biogenesis protein
MHLAGLSLPLVFAAGVVSFASPCVLPLVPGYLSTVGGVSVAELGTSRVQTSRVARSSAAFFAGFLLVFLALGASASAVGELLSSERRWLDRAAGLLIIIFGLSLLGFGHASLTAARWSGAVQRTAKRRGGPVAIGAAFAFSWTPCVGPVLASILGLAGTTASLTTGVALLAVYGVGLAVPFLVVGFGLSRCLAALKSLHRHYRKIEIGSGALLVGMGALLVTDELFMLNVYAQRVLDALGFNWWSTL